MRFISSFFFSLLAFQVLAVDTSQKYTYSVPPFEPFYYPELSSCTGIADDLSQQLFTTLGVQSTRLTLPYSRILHSVANNKVDMALIFRNSSIENTSTYIGPISLSRVLIITAPKITVEKYEDLYQLNSVAVIRDAQFHKHFDQDEKIKKVAVKSYSQAIKMLEKGRVDAVIGSDIGLVHAMKTLDVRNDYMTTAYELGKKAWYFHFHRQSKLLAHTREIKDWVRANYRSDLMISNYVTMHDSCSSQKPTR